MTEEVKKTIINLIQDLTNPIVGHVDVNFTKEGEHWRVNINSKDGKELIGKKNELLNSLQHIVRVLTHKIHPEDKSHFLIDINNFKNRKEKILNETIPGTAKTEVLQNGKTVILVGLNGYERLIIHKLLAEVDGLETTSVGADPNRKLVVRPTSETGSVSMEESKVIDVTSLFDM